MAKYIEVKNNNNIVSVDDKQPRLSLIRSVNLETIGTDQSGTFAWLSYGGQEQYCIRSFFRFPIGLGANEKMFSIRALQDNPHVGFTRLASNDSVSYLYAYVNAYGTTDGSFDFSKYIIDFYGYDDTVTGQTGLQVFDENGKIVFNSNKYYFDVKGLYNVQHADGTARIFVDSADIFPRNINIGGHSRDKSAVVINCGGYNFCKFSSYYDTPYDVVFTVVFNGTIYLEPRIVFWVNDKSTYTNPSNHIAFPNFARLSSGTIIDTTNIS